MEKGSYIISCIYIQFLYTFLSSVAKDHEKNII